MGSKTHYDRMITAHRSGNTWWNNGSSDYDPEYEEFRKEQDDEYKINKEPSYFETFQEAMAWAKNNPGQVITRAPNGQRFMLKKK